MTRARLLTTAVALVAAVVVGVASAVPAAAAAYRYWTYWVGTDGGWTFATAGPASLLPADGSVQGWRFAVAMQAASPANQPRTAPSFDDICAGTPAQEGMKRVALVIDPGLPADAPAGQSPGEPTTACVVADPDATGYQVMRAVVPVRSDSSGLICGIDGYPTGECAPVVEEAVATATPGPTAVGAGSAMDMATPDSSDDSGTPWAVLAVLVVVAAVAGLIVWRRPRD